MRTPTRDEIKSGYHAITRDGAGAQITHELAVLIVSDPLLKSTIDQMLRSAGVLARMADDDALFRGALGGALIYGIHMGLHIGEQRAAKQAAYYEFRQRSET